MSVRCLECNAIHYDLRAHLRKHKMTAAQYEAKHGVKVTSVTMIPGWMHNGKKRNS